MVAGKCTCTSAVSESHVIVDANTNHSFVSSKADNTRKKSENFSLKILRDHSRTVVKSSSGSLKTTVFDGDKFKLLHYLGNEDVKLIQNAKH